MTTPTIYDVAREAGVSIKTVSRVINDEPNVRTDTVERVRAAIAALNYHPNPAARRLSGGRLPTLGVIVDSINDPFFGELIEVLEARATELGMDVLVAATGMDDQRMQLQLKRLIRRGVSGLVVAPFGVDKKVRELLPDELPVIVIDRKSGIEDRDVVRVTDRGGAAGAVRHLLAHGHRRIAFLGVTGVFTTVQDRWEGYRDALGAAGLPIDPALVVNSAWGADEAYPLVHALLTGPEPPTGIFAATPQMGHAVLRAQRDCDRQDIALVVFGDFPMAGLMTPPTTVVDQMAADLANVAFDHLIRRQGDIGAPILDTVVGTRLIVRGSGELPPPEVQGS